jgi:carbamoyl-phosphate synthase large subunit
MSKRQPTTILVTGVGDTVGQAIVKAARQMTLSCRVVGTDRDEFSVGLHWADAGFVVPHCSEREAYLAEIRRICDGEDVQLVLPGSEKELQVLSENAPSLLRETGAVVVCSPPEVLRVSMDKWETCRFLEGAGLRFPRYARCDNREQIEQLIETANFPLIAKPVRGTGARGVFNIRSRDDLAQVLNSAVEMVLQEYLLPEAEEYSVEVYTLKNGQQAGSLCYRRDQLIAGDTYNACVMPHPAAEAEARAVAAALHTTGPCNVQLRVTARGPVTFEVNPRFSGGVSMRAHFGYNEVEMAVRDLVLNEPVPEPRTSFGRARRFWGEMYFSDNGTSGSAERAKAERTPAHAPEPAIQILRTRDAAEWHAVLSKTRQHDFHHLPQYHRMAEQLGQGTARFFVYSENGYTIALPLLLRPVDPNEPDGWQDATSVYGYAGPVASHEVPPDSLVENFQSALRDELSRARVVSVFSRLHPLIAQQEMLAGLGECVENGQTISIDLTLPDDEQRAQYNKSCRTSLRKLRAAGFVCVNDHEKRYLQEFVEVYLETMRRAGAQSSYFFDRSYFEMLTRELGEVSHLFVVLKDGDVAAATICTNCAGIVQDHLGGTRDAFLKFSPDRLVVDTERSWAKESGARVFHLGGGVNAQQDSVFQYKAGFSHRRHIFRTWRCTIEPNVYQELCAKTGRNARTDGASGGAAQFFPTYRSPITRRDTSYRTRGRNAIHPDAAGWFIRARDLQRLGVPLIDFQTHTRWTDGRSSVAQMRAAAETSGLRALALTEHVNATSAWYPEFVAEVKRQRRCAANLDVYFGAEIAAADYRGGLKADPSRLEAEIVLGVVHRLPKQNRNGFWSFDELTAEDAIELEIRALIGLADNPRISVIGHPGGTVFKKFGGFPVDWLEPVFRAARDRGVAVEINTKYLWDADRLLALLYRVNPLLSFGSDAHEAREVGSNIPVLRQHLRRSSILTPAS